MNIDAFKATKNTIGKMAFHIVNNKTGKTFDILEARTSIFLIKYFKRFPRKQRLNLKFIITDLFDSYYKLCKTIFPNAITISNKFHVVALASNALSLTRIKCMKKTLKTFNKFKEHILMALKYDYNNGIIKGKNSLIKCVKRIEFGYRSFYHFKARIMLVAFIYKY